MLLNPAQPGLFPCITLSSVTGRGFDLGMSRRFTVFLLPTLLQGL